MRLFDLFHMLHWGRTCLVTMAMTVYLTLHAGCASGPAFVAASPPTDKALVYFYRPSRMLGAAGAWRIVIDGTPIVSMKNGGYYTFEFGPEPIEISVAEKYAFTSPTAKEKTIAFIGSGIIGVMVLNIQKGHESVGVFQFEPGETYYYRYEFTSPTTSGFVRVSTEVGEKEITKTKLLTPLKKAE